MNHPSDNDLAAFLEGLLPQAEAARVREHLGSCSTCYEVFALASESIQDQGSGNVRPLRRPTLRLLQGFAAAACLVGVVALSVLWRPSDPAVLIARKPTPAVLDALMRSPRWNAVRGTGGGSTTPLKARIGVVWADIAIASHLDPPPSNLQANLGAIAALLATDPGAEPLAAAALEEAGRQPADLDRVAKLLALIQRHYSGSSDWRRGYNMELARVACAVGDGATVRRLSERPSLGHIKAAVGGGDCTAWETGVQALTGDPQ